MAKNTYYFPHDYHARHDPKLEKIYLKHGHIAWGIYWHLIEMLYEQGGYLLLEDISLYAKGDQSLSERFNDIIKLSGLFQYDDIRFWSESCLSRLDHLSEKREKAAISGALGGKISGNTRRIEANAKRTLSENEPIKESKGDKVKEIKESITGSRFNEFWSLYPKPLGQSMAFITFRATVKTDKDFEGLKTALSNYRESKEYKDGYIKNGDRWIEDWRGWLALAPKKQSSISKYEVKNVKC